MKNKLVRWLVYHGYFKTAYSISPSLTTVLLVLYFTDLGVDPNGTILYLDRTCYHRDKLLW